MNELMIELRTAGGLIFSGISESISLRTDGGSMHVTASEDCFLNMLNATEITLRVGHDTLVFALKNAAASLRDRRLTVIAEKIHRIEPASP